MSKRARPNPEEGKEDKPEYYYQKHYNKCGHTINRFDWCDGELYSQFKAGRMPSIRFSDFCPDCKSRQELEGANLDGNTTLLRAMINVYVVKLDKYSRKVSEQASELQQLHQKSGKDDAELEKLNSSLKASEAEVEKQKSTVYRQGMELGELRKKAKDFKNPNGGSIIDGVIVSHPSHPQIQTTQQRPTQNPNLQPLRSNGALAPAVQTPNLQPLGSLTKNIAPGKTPKLQDTAKKKKFKLIATIGYINPIASGFSTLKQDLEEHKWEPFVKSLFTELEEAVRRNDWEEICVVHDRMHSFAEAFDNDLRERIEKAELEIIRQCEEGVERLLGAMM